jgi:CheY-like chemotaxis protein
MSFVATDGAQGIAMATSEQPDLILMDLTLPDIDGEEATRRIKGHCPSISSARHSDGSARTRECGFQDNRVVIIGM